METEDLIDKYYLHQLTPREEEQMETLLKEDMVFRAEFDFRENLRRAIKDTERDKLKEKLNGLEKSYNKTNEKTLWKTWQIAAGIVLLLGIAGLGFYLGIEPNVQKLYAQNYAPYPNTEFNITRGEGTVSLERKAFTAYEAGEYNDAIPLFEKFSAQGEKPTVSFYLGQSLLAAGKTERALAIFEKLVDQNGDFAPEARWYAALAALKLRDTAKVEDLLRKIIAVNGYRSAQARELLKRLE